MKIIMTMVLFMCTPVYSQIGSMEKQAVHMAQHTLVSQLDADLPGSAFGLWFNQVIGPDATVIWQLTECGEHAAQANETERDLIACAEANAILPDGRQVIVAISVGTFKKGIVGKPAFYSAVIDQNDQLYRIRRLRDLPRFLRRPEKLPIPLPDIAATFPRIRLSSMPIYVSSLNMSPYPWTESAPHPDASKTSSGLRRVQELSGSAKPHKVQDGTLQGRATVVVKPVYPPMAKNMRIFGEVKVQVLISENGRVINAKAISGNPVLQASAVEAARKWVFYRTLVDGVPVKAEGVLTFSFNPGSN